MRQLSNRISDRALFRRIARSRSRWAMLDQIVFTAIPLILLTVIILLKYPPTAVPIRRFISEWYYSLESPSERARVGPTSAVQPSLTRSTF